MHLMSWRDDLWAVAARRTWPGAVLTWFSNPGFAVVVLYRIARRLEGSRALRPFATFAKYWMITSFNCEISPGAAIGPGCAIPHPFGVVVGRGSVIGRDVTIFQNVTIGRRRIDDPAYPIIGDGVTIYAGAFIIGGVRIGDGATIGANAVVTQDVPPGGFAIAPAAQVRAPSEASAGVRRRNV